MRQCILFEDFFGGFIQTKPGSPLPGSLKVIFWDSSLIWSSSIKMASEWVQNQCFQSITNYIFLESSCNLQVSYARKRVFLEPNLVVGARQILQNGFKINVFFKHIHRMQYIYSKINVFWVVFLVQMSLVSTYQASIQSWTLLNKYIDFNEPALDI